MRFGLGIHAGPFYVGTSKSTKRRNRSRPTTETVYTDTEYIETRTRTYEFILTIDGEEVPAREGWSQLTQSEREQVWATLSPREQAELRKALVH